MYQKITNRKCFYFEIVRAHFEGAKPVQCINPCKTRAVTYFTSRFRMQFNSESFEPQTHENERGAHGRPNY